MASKNVRRYEGSKITRKCQSYVTVPYINCGIASVCYDSR